MASVEGIALSADLIADNATGIAGKIFVHVNQIAPPPPPPPPPKPTGNNMIVYLVAAAMVGGALLISSSSNGVKTKGEQNGS